MMVERQWLFLQDLSLLIQNAVEMDGVMLTGGDLYQDNDWHDGHSAENRDGAGPPWPKYTPHLPTGQHPRRLAIDLNLFVYGEYITGAHDVYYALGSYWAHLSEANRWGGGFTKRDYNHFEAYYP